MITVFAVFVKLAARAIQGVEDMNLLYMDCFSGISGDMWISSLLNLGLPFQDLSEYIRHLNLGVELSQETCTLSGITATRFFVTDTKSQPLRHLHDVFAVLESVHEDSIRQQAQSIFHLLADTEARVHGISPAAVHFHEIGAADTLVDVVGVLYGLQQLKVDRVYASPVPWSRGIVHIEHGHVPLPAPATAELLCDIPCYGVDAGMELVTPTGAALLKSLVVKYGDLPSCQPLAIGYGAGLRQRRDGIPNLLRVVLAKSDQPASIGEPISILECEIDDMNPEFFTYLFELFNSSGSVRDFYVTPIQMKKNRPGFLLTILCDPVYAHELANTVLIETTSLGVRICQQQRLVLPRQETIVSSPWGPVRCKTVQLPNGLQRSKPEYEDCVQISRQHNLPLSQVYSHILHLCSQNNS